MILKFTPNSISSVSNKYSSGRVNLNMVNSKFHLIRIFYDVFMNILFYQLMFKIHF